MQTTYTMTNRRDDRTTTSYDDTSSYARGLMYAYRISPKKFEVYLTNPDITGHEHADGGMRPSLPRYQSIVETPEPTTIGHVYHGMSAMG